MKVPINLQGLDTRYGYLRSAQGRRNLWTMWDPFLTGLSGVHLLIVES